MKISDIHQAYNEGRYLFRSINKNIGGSALVYIDSSMCSGNPSPQFYSGDALTSKILNQNSVGSIRHIPYVAGYRQFIHKLYACCITSNVSYQYQFLDYLMYYPFIEMDGVQELVNTTPLSRSTSGEGVMMMMVSIFPSSGVATFRVNYTNQYGEANRLTPIIGINTSMTMGNICTYRGTSSNVPGRYISLQSPDYGVRSIQSIEFLTPDTGIIALVLVKPICKISHSAFAFTEIDFLQFSGTMPEIEKDAFLGFLASFNTSISANIQLDLTTVLLKEN